MNYNWGNILKEGDVSNRKFFARVSETETEESCERKLLFDFVALRIIAFFFLYDFMVSADLFWSFWAIFSYFARNAIFVFGFMPSLLDHLSDFGD